MPPYANRLARLTEQDDEVKDDLTEILDGLARPQKTLSPKYFYDERGSDLFDQITRLPEYYLTRTEQRIMEDNIDEIVNLIGRHASLIEFGSGSNRKIRLLLEHLHEPAVYVPVDISRDYLLAAAEDLAADFRHIQIMPVAADFTLPFELPNPRIMPKRNVVFFPGSTIGNFTPEAALDLLKVMHHEAGEDGGLLIGVDLQKDIDVIERAYNDAAGITAQFNLNALQHLNDAYAADFDLDAFEHIASYNAEHGRIEMYLISRRAQQVRIGGQRFDFTAGERVLTEHSHKYSLDGFAELAARAGFKVAKVWTDANSWFSVQYCTRD